MLMHWNNTVNQVPDWISRSGLSVAMQYITEYWIKILTAFAGRELYHPNISITSQQRKQNCKLLRSFGRLRSEYVNNSSPCNCCTKRHIIWLLFQLQYINWCLIKEVKNNYIFCLKRASWGQTFARLWMSIL